MVDAELRKAVVEVMRAELKRQYEDPEGNVGWYTEQITDGELRYVAFDGNPDLNALAERVIEEVQRSKKSG